MGRFFHLRQMRHGRERQRRMRRVVRMPKQGLVTRKQGTEGQVSLPEKKVNHELNLVRKGFTLKLGEKWLYLDTR